MAMVKGELRQLQIAYPAGPAAGHRSADHRDGAAGIGWLVKTTFCTLWMSVLLVGAAPHATAQLRTPTEYEIKALFLYEFGRFVEWPPSPEGESDPFPICVLGEDPFGVLLDEALRNKSSAGHAVIARRILGISETGKCRILFISPSEDRRLPEILGDLEGKSILTVGEGVQFTRRGGIIGFLMQGNRVRFAINMEAAGRVGLRLSSQLLRLATLD